MTQVCGREPEPATLRPLPFAKPPQRFRFNDRQHEAANFPGILTSPPKTSKRATGFLPPSLSTNNTYKYVSFCYDTCTQPSSVAKYGQRKQLERSRFCTQSLVKNTAQALPSKARTSQPPCTSCCTQTRSLLPMTTRRLQQFSLSLSLSPRNLLSSVKTSRCTTGLPPAFSIVPLCMQAQ